jgi:hypothetical protein
LLREEERVVYNLEVPKEKIGIGFRDLSWEELIEEDLGEFKAKETVHPSSGRNK